MTSLVSVIIPVYNDQQGIFASISALAEQTWPRDCLEVVVVDNNSNPAICLDSKWVGFAHLVRCATPGAYAARNAGIAEARGDILAFTDADCVPDRNWIKAGVAALARAKGSSIVGGEVKLIMSPRPTTVERYQCLTGFSQRDNIAQLGFSVTANLFVTRAQIDRIGKFNDLLMSGGDREWSWRAAQSGLSIRYSAEAMVRTSPRKSLRAAARQARRVAGGRQALRRLGAVHVKSTNLRSHRSTFGAIRWILTHPELSALQRWQVFVVASILKMVNAVEIVRLSVGFRPERR